MNTKATIGTLIARIKNAADYCKLACRASNFNKQAKMEFDKPSPCNNLLEVPHSKVTVC